MLDLHSHSTCSDGSEPPARVVELAAAAGCTTLALTDHDTFAGLAEARRRADELGIGLLNGCEVSATRRGLSLHLLCYFFDEPGVQFPELLTTVRADRAARNSRLAARLGELGVPDALDLATAEAKGDVVGRPHFAAVLVERQLAASIGDAFARFLAPGGTAYVPRLALDPSKVISTARQAGGVVSLAHPLTYDMSRQHLASFVEELTADGLSGIEAYYASYSPVERMELATLAREHGLVPTGGSDFHGRYRPESAVGVGRGDLDVPDDLLDELANRAT